MKKIMIVFPAIICLILSLFVPFSSLAADYSTPSDCIVPISYFTNDNPLKEYYLHFAYSYNPDSSPSKTDVDTIFFHTDQVPEVTTEFGKITVTFNQSVDYYVRYYRVNSGSQGGNYGSFTTVVIDIDKSEVSFDDTVFPSVRYKSNIQTLLLNTSFKPVSSTPNVIVEFSPVLKGIVDRTVVNSNGTKSNLQDLQMTVNNLSSFPIQYKMSIVMANPVTYRQITDDIFGDTDNENEMINNQKDWLNTHYDDDPVFIYYSNTQVYEGSISSTSRVHDSMNPQLYNKASEWHKLGANQTDTVTIPFSMINLKQGTEYFVKVECYKLDHDYVCSIIGSNENLPIFVDDSTYVCPYYERFSFLKYSDIVYNPSLSSGSVLPFDGTNGVAQFWGYDNNYDAVTDPKSGKLDIGHYDYLKDPSSWVNNSSNIHKYEGSNNFNFNDYSFSVTSFSGMFSNVFGAVSMFMNYLPSSIMYIYVFGFSSIVVIAIIKAVK